jgi:hypothetical protein
MKIETVLPLNFRFSQNKLEYGFEPEPKSQIFGKNLNPEIVPELYFVF